MCSRKVWDLIYRTDQRTDYRLDQKVWLEILIFVVLKNRLVYYSNDPNRKNSIFSSLLVVISRSGKQILFAKWYRPSVLNSTFSPVWWDRCQNDFRCGCFSWVMNFDVLIFCPFSLPLLTAHIFENIVDSPLDKKKLMIII